MHSKIDWDPGSFRDQEGSVFIKNNEIFRSLNASAVPRMERLLSSHFFSEYIREGKVVPTKILKNSFKEKNLHGNYLLKHDTIPLVTYPYEWSFSMLKEGALLTLSLLKDCLSHGFILKDGTAWNVTCYRGRMCFFDVLSIGDYEDGQTWNGYTQFCQEFLYPLFLKSYKNIEFQSFFRGSLKGIDPHLASSLFTISDWHLPGVFKHVFLHAKLTGSKSVSNDIVKSKFKFPKKSLIYLIDNLIQLVQELSLPQKESTWINYTKNNTYENSDTKAKGNFISKFVEKAEKNSTIVDLGCNTGHFSLLAAKTHSIISCDIDSNCIDSLYKTIQKKSSGTVTPIVLDLMNPSPACGWKLQERRSIYDRIQGDSFFALALIHHLCISQNVPLKSFISFLKTIAPRGVLEWVSKEDPMVQFLLRNREDIFDEYNWDHFQGCVSQNFKIVKTELLNQGTRTLCWLEKK